MADDVGSVEQRAGARRRLAKLSYSNGDWREAERLIAQAWSLLEDQPATPERAWVLSTMSFGDATQDRRKLAEQAIAEARAVGAPGPEADALISLAFLLQHDGDVDGAMARLEEARDKAAASGADDTELRAYFNMAMLRYDHGDLAAAHAHALAGNRAAERRGRSWAGYGRELRWLLDIIEVGLGRFTDVVERTTAALGAAPHTSRSDLYAARPLASCWLGDWQRVDEDVAADALASCWLGDWQRVDEDVAVITPLETVAQQIIPGGVVAPIDGHAIAASWLWRVQYEDFDRALTQAMEDPPYPDDLAQIRV